MQKGELNMIEVQGNKYELIKDVKNAFDKDEFSEMYTDYYKDYDYIVGDEAYSKTRLKGFFDSKNKRVNKINNFDDVDKYLKDFCAVNCGHFILKKVQ